MEPKFVELTTYSDKPISIRIDQIIAFYSNPYFKEGRKIPTTIIILGNNTYEVEEDYKTVSKKINGMGQKELTIEYSPKDKELIEKWIETLNNIGCTTFSSLGMTDDEWHRAIAGFSD